MAFSFNMKLVTKMPGLMKEAAEEMTTDLKEVKEAIDNLKANMPKLKSDGAACSAKNVKDPVGCYKLIYGPIKYTRQQRSAWEYFMTDRLRAKGVTFKPENYPTTDMIEEAAGAKQ